MVTQFMIYSPDKTILLKNQSRRSKNKGLVLGVVWLDPSMSYQDPDSWRWGIPRRRLGWRMYRTVGSTCCWFGLFLCVDAVPFIPGTVNAHDYLIAIFSCKICCGFVSLGLVLRPSVAFMSSDLWAQNYVLRLGYVFRLLVTRLD